MPSSPRHRFRPSTSVLPICAALTITLGVYAFGSGVGALEPVLFFFSIGLTVSLAVARHRRRQGRVSPTPADAAVGWLVDTGRVRAGVVPTIERCGGGVTVTVATVPDADFGAARYFVDAAGVITFLPSSCGSARRFWSGSPPSRTVRAS